MPGSLSISMFWFVTLLLLLLPSNHSPRFHSSLSFSPVLSTVQSLSNCSSHDSVLRCWRDE